MIMMNMSSPRNVISLSLVWLSSSWSTTSAFLYSPQAHSNVASLSKSIDTEQILQLKLDVGLSHREQQQNQRYGAEARMALQGPLVQLSSRHPATASSSVPLPGATQAKQVSTGTMALDIVRPASYITLEGLQSVAMEKACWEMIWLEAQDSGKFTCAFHLPVPVHRNGVTLPAGHMYVSFGIYTPESLAVAQLRKRTTLQHYNRLLQEKQDELQKSKDAKNPIVKAIHYQRAFAALDQMLILPTISHIPESDQVLPLHHGALLVVQEGIVWRKTDAYLGGLLGPSTERVGRAILSVVRPPSQEQEHHNRIRRLIP